MLWGCGDQSSFPRRGFKRKHNNTAHTATANMESLEKLNVMFVYICLIIQECFNVSITRFGG